MFRLFTRQNSNSGHQAEQLACKYLEQQGLILLEQNYQCKRGEIDLVMQDNNTLVFIEVKYRKNSRYGHAAEFVTEDKQRKIILAAQYYLQKHSKLTKLPVRFDVVAIEGLDNLNWIKSAFESFE